MRWIMLLLLLASCSTPIAQVGTHSEAVHENPVWYAETPVLQAALQDAADLLCDASDGAHCPTWTEDPEAAARRIEPGVLPPSWCGLASPGQYPITIDYQPGECAHFVPEPTPAVGQWLAVPPDGLEGQWRLATEHEALTLIIAHELGHTLGWGHEDTPGALMQPEAGFRSIPLTLPDNLAP
jgi:hypothetical protein